MHSRLKFFSHDASLKVPVVLVLLLPVKKNVRRKGETPTLILALTMRHVCAQTLALFESFEVCPR